MPTKPRKILFVCHNHPAVRPGGAEGYAFEVYQALRESPDFDPIFLARADPPEAWVSPRHADAVIGSVTPADPNQYFIYSDKTAWDWLFERSSKKESLTRSFHEFLLAHRPDVVHFQHTFLIGYDIIRVTRNTFPDVPILYTLHDFIPICHHNGQMVRTERKRFQLCRQASPRRCNECYPHIPPDQFFMRERFIKSQFRLVDMFIAPSHTLRERYVDWGIPEEKIIFEDYGRLPIKAVSEPDREGPRNRFAFFGQFTPFKGVDLLIEVMRLLGKDFEGHLWLHGGNLDLQPQEFQERMRPLLEDTSETVTVAGPFNRTRLSELMAQIDWVVVPSIWWENSPLVIQEAFQHRRPVICSDIGGMAEKVEDGLSGLHFRRSDAQHLAAVMKRAATEAGLWDRLREGIPAIHPMDDHVARLTEVYEELIARSDGHLVSVSGARQVEPPQ